MLKTLMMIVALLTAGLSAAAASTAAVSTANVNLRAGPATSFPVVTVVPAGSRVVAHGCVADYTWCDIAHGTARGWVSARYIQIVYNGAPVVLTPVVAPAAGITVVTYNRTYWDTYYVAYPWYGSWNTYYQPYAAPRVNSHNRAAACVDGTCAGARTTTSVFGGSTNQIRTCSGGECSATRNSTGRYGNSASRTRTCNANDLSCNMSRTGPRGGTATGTRTFNR
ncbi:SH3 domain-containing protein [Pseudovibrio sp. SPO723]|uniref:SH3 domain-containing protein n=1 Tax=Nesiotobacter zosterae TaxID=392721 RepID=UPI0029C3A9EC|nr:SH3 domain-containing protein [Pseudovibrio sp. SPO723]MDX5595716.1 SH3 domain-containing protein [Pseudovibrio sp. SPO723]